MHEPWWNVAISYERLVRRRRRAPLGCQNGVHAAWHRRVYAQRFADETAIHRADAVLDFWLERVDFG